MRPFGGFIIAGLLIISLLFPSISESYDASKVHAGTFQEIKSFLETDKTDEHKFTREYNCVNFSIDLWRNAYLEGLDAFIVIDNGMGKWDYHISMGFYVANGTKLFIDPQSDVVETPKEIIAILLGRTAYRLWQEKSGQTNIKFISFCLDLIVNVYKIKNGPRR